MKKLIILLEIVGCSYSLISCSETKTPNFPEEKIWIKRYYDELGNLNTEGINVFRAKVVENITITGADETKFAWTVSKGGTILPTSFSGVVDVLLGEITEDKVLDSTRKYEIRGAVYVRSGATLTIPAGTILFSDPANNANSLGQSSGVNSADVLIVNQGGKLIAEGTESSPIIFTSKDATKGDWGGIVLLGKAPINIITLGNAEVSDNISDASLPYGGNVAADNSGILRYVILAYTGTKINTESEYNGFSFYGIGSGTVLENLEVYQGDDDSFEWFGGTVNAKNLYGNSFDDTFDWSEGYVGQLDNIVSEQPNGADHCIEADNLNANHNAEPVSHPKINNATFKSSGDDDAIKLRRGTAVSFNAILIEMAKVGKANFEVDDEVTAKNIIEEVSKFSNIKIDSENTFFAGNLNN